MYRHRSITFDLCLFSILSIMWLIGYLINSDRMVVFSASGSATCLTLSLFYFIYCVLTMGPDAE